MSEAVARNAPSEFELDEIPVKDYFSGKLHDSIVALTPSMLLRSEQSLSEEIVPTPLDYDLRRTFWKVIEEAKALKKTHIPTARVYEDICAPSYFFNYFLVNPVRMAWMIRPIENHTAFYEAINRAALQKLLDFVRTEPVTSKNAALIAKIAEMSANRAYGAVAQKMQIQSKNLNVEVQANQSYDVEEIDIRSQLDEAKKKLLVAKDVTPNVDDE